MKSRFSYLLSLWLLFASAAAYASDGPIAELTPAHRVLFVGNSFTFYNNGLHTHLRKFLNSRIDNEDTAFAQKMTTISGGYLAQHQPGLPSLLKSFKPDVVVLQGYSTESIEPAEAAAFRSSVKTLARMARKHNANPVLLMTWAYTGKPEMTDQIARAYESVGAEYGLKVLPVGLAFALAEATIPGIRLRVDDLKHPTLEGSYLAAAVIYSALYRLSPVNLSYTAGLDADLAQRLRETAWNVVSSYTQ